MKKIIILLVCLNLGMLTVLISQTSIEDKKYSLQFNAGLGQTFHYNSPVTMLICFEGCLAKEQRARTGRSGQLSLYRRLNHRHEIKLGAGYSEYKFWERGISSSGFGIPSPYIRDIFYNFWNVELGHRYSIFQRKSNTIFLENNLITDINIGETALKKAAWSYKIRLGGLHHLNSKIGFLLNAYFKTALLRYSRNRLSNRYYPYDYGVELGIFVKW